MKSQLLVIITLLCSSQVFAQCTPESGFSGTGMVFTPEQLDPVFACTECGSHERVISLQTFPDTTLSVNLSPGNPPTDITVFADRFRLDSIAGLPAGLSYTTNAAFDTTYDEILNPFGYWVNGGDTATGFISTTGCITISGDANAWTAAAGGGPNNDGLYPLTIYIDVRAADFDPSAIAPFVGYNTWLSDMGAILPAFGDPNFTTNGIRYEAISTLNVQASGVSVAELDGFSNLNSHFNPLNGLATFNFGSSEQFENATITVYSVLGSRDFENSFRVNQGANTLTADLSQLTAGTYIYTLQSTKNFVSGKLIVQ